MYIWCLVAMRVPDVGPAGGAAACTLGAGASCGMTPGPGGPELAGEPPAPPAIGGWPPVGGPFCANASEVPPTSSATIARPFTVIIVYLQYLRRTHPDTHEKCAKDIACSTRGKK